MNDLPPHVEQKWKIVERKAALRGATLSTLLRDIEEAVRASVDWLLKEDSVKQLAQANNCENTQGDTVQDDSKS